MLDGVKKSIILILGAFLAGLSGFWLWGLLIGAGSAFLHCQFSGVTAGQVGKNKLFACFPAMILFGVMDLVGAQVGGGLNSVSGWIITFVLMAAAAIVGSFINGSKDITDKIQQGDQPQQQPDVSTEQIGVEAMLANARRNRAGGQVQDDVPRPILSANVAETEEPELTKELAEGFVAKVSLYEAVVAKTGNKYFPKCLLQGDPDWHGWTDADLEEELSRFYYQLPPPFGAIDIESLKYLADGHDPKDCINDLLPLFNGNGTSKKLMQTHLALVPTGLLWGVLSASERKSQTNMLIDIERNMDMLLQVFPEAGTALEIWRPVTLRNQTMEALTERLKTTNPSLFQSYRGYVGKLVVMNMHLMANEQQALNTVLHDQVKELTGNADISEASISWAFKKLPYHERACLPDEPHKALMWRGQNKRLPFAEACKKYFSVPQFPCFITDYSEDSTDYAPSYLRTLEQRFDLTLPYPFNIMDKSSVEMLGRDGMALFDASDTSEKVWLPNPIKNVETLPYSEVKAVHELWLPKVYAQVGLDACLAKLQKLGIKNDSKLTPLTFVLKNLDNLSKSLKTTTTESKTLQGPFSDVPAGVMREIILRSSGIDDEDCPDAMFVQKYLPLCASNVYCSNEEPLGSIPALLLGNLIGHEAIEALANDSDYTYEDDKTGVMHINSYILKNKNSVLKLLGDGRCGYWPKVLVEKFGYDALFSARKFWNTIEPDEYWRLWLPESLVRMPYDEIAAKLGDLYDPSYIGELVIKHFDKLI